MAPPACRIGRAYSSTRRGWTSEDSRRSLRRDVITRWRKSHDSTDPWRDHSLTGDLPMKEGCTAPQVVQGHVAGAVLRYVREPRNATRLVIQSQSVNGTPGAVFKQPRKIVRRAHLQRRKMEPKHAIVKTKGIKHVLVPSLTSIHSSTHKPEVAPFVRQLRSDGLRHKVLYGVGSGIPGDPMARVSTNAGICLVEAPLGRLPVWTT